MPMYDAGIRVLNLLLAGMALAGMVTRRRIAACVSFPVHLSTDIVGRVLVLVWPDRFWTWDFVFWTDAVQVAVRAAIVLELTYKVFRPLPEGLQHVRLMLALVLTGMVLAFLVYPPRATNAFEGTLVLQQVSYGVAFLFIAFLLVTWYHGVPLDPLHRDIACGFGALNFVLAFATALSEYDPAYDWGRYFIIKTAYPFLLAGWCVSAWRPDTPSRLSPRTMRILQPWRVR